MVKAVEELWKGHSKLVRTAEWSERDGLLHLRGKIYVPGSLELRCWIMSQHQSSRSRRSVEDPGIGSLQLLVATDVSLHQSICEDMRSLPLDQGTMLTSDRRTSSAPCSGVPLGHYQR